MRLTVFFFILYYFHITLNVNAQAPCGYGILHGILASEDPNYLIESDEVEEVYVSHNLCEDDEPFNGPYEIPVVVHVMHNGGPENISDVQIANAIAQTNSQLAGMEGEYDTKIKLVLAKKDPAGNCTNGILRNNIPNPDIDVFGIDDDIALKNISRWPYDRYLNIWIVRNIAGDISGYSYPPLADEPLHGIVVKYNRFGTIEAANNNQTNTLTHELGHFLNLMHVWGFDEYDPLFKCTLFCHTLEGGLVYGDRVCDTNPCQEVVVDNSCDPYYESCMECPNWYSDLHYPKENYMSYHHECHNQFTEGQAKRMWFALNYYDFRQSLYSEENKICTGILGYYGENITINSTINWTVSNLPNNGIITINGNLVVESGGSLTIEPGVIVHFCADKKLIIKPNGKVTLHGTLTNSCGKAWKGVEVWGNSSLPQSLVGGVMPQGRLNSYSGAIIENAITGVQLWGPDKETNAGGQLSCSGTIFRNNRIGVEFAPYLYEDQFGQPHNYRGGFKKCKMVTDDEYSIQDPFYAFIYMDGVRQIPVLACTFSNTQSLPNANSIIDFGYGIYSMDAGFRVEPICNGVTFPCNTTYTYSTFSGLGYGIYTSNFHFSQPFIVNSAEFTDCYMGIYNSAVSMGTIVENTFNMGNLSNTDLADDQVGIMIENPISGITAEQNIFLKSGNFSNTIGIICKNLHSYNNIIRKNYFNNIRKGNLANGLNANISLERPARGLRYYCNNNYSNGVADFEIFGKICREQGVEIPGTNPLTYQAAGNIFSSNTGTPTTINNQGETLRYHYFNISNQIPTAAIGITSNSAVENPCDANFCLPPCPVGISIVKANFYGSKTSYTNAFAAYQVAVANNNGVLKEQKSREAAHYRNLMDKYAHSVTLHMLYDTVSFNEDSLYTWLKNMDNYAADLWLANLKFKKGEYTATNSILNIIPTKHQLTLEELADLEYTKDIYDLLENKSIYNLDASSIEELELIANEETATYAKKTAQNLLTLLGWHFPPTYEVNGDNFGFRSSPDKEENASNRYSELINVYPNPGNNHIVFDLSNIQIDHISSLELYNQHGQSILSINSITEPSVILNTVELNNGMYYYKITFNKGHALTGKVFINK